MLGATSPVQGTIPSTNQVTEEIICGPLDIPTAISIGSPIAQIIGLEELLTQSKTESELTDTSGFSIFSDTLCALQECQPAITADEQRNLLTNVSREKLQKLQETDRIRLILEKFFVEPDCRMQLERALAKNL